MIGPRPDLEETLDAGGVELHLEHFRPMEPPLGAVVTVHGFAAHCGLYRHVGAALARHGLAVTAFDCRGHGRSGGRRAYVPRFQAYVDDLDRVLRRARSLVPQVPAVVMGHSHGATIALAHALAAAAPPARLVLATPFLALRLPVPAWKRLLAPAVSVLWPTLAMDNELRGEDVSRNPDVVANFGADPLVLHVATARWFQEVRRVQATLRAAAAQLAVPALLLAAGGDRIVDTDVALAFAAAAGARVEVRRYEPLFHELFLEPERDQVIADIAAWIRAQLGDLGQAPARVPGILSGAP